MGDPDIITVQPIYDIEKQMKSSDIYEKVRLEESNEELKMDLGGYLGDFNRHRVGDEIKKRVGITETELFRMMAKDDKLKEIARTLR